MGETSVEWKRLQIEWIKKNGTYTEYLSKKKFLMAQNRKNEKGLVENMRKSVWEDYLKDKRKLKKLRERCCIGKGKQKKVSQTETYYHLQKQLTKLEAAKARVMARVKHNLLNSPCKKRAIIKELGFEQIQVKPFIFIKRRKSFLYNPEIKKSIKWDDISQQSQHAWDYVKMLNVDDEEITIQKQHLVMSVNEAYVLWKSENPKPMSGNRNLHHFAQIMF